MSKLASKIKKRGPGRPRADERDLQNEVILEAATAVFLEQAKALPARVRLSRRSTR